MPGDSASKAQVAQPAFADHGHDHEQCRRDALERAAAMCRRRGARLTEGRRRVLELVWQSHSPVGAYELLDALRAQGANAAPPTVYRALDFLVEQGLVHRIESLNAFIGCALPDEAHGTQFLICESCGDAAEISDRTIGGAIGDVAQFTGFDARRSTVEVFGTCPNCQTASGR